MLESAERCIADAKQASISLETRLDAAYRGITQLSMVALWANGVRPAKSKPGHHRTMIQSLSRSIALDRDEVLLIDTFRVKRNAIDYTGEAVDEASVDACIEASDRLMTCVREWLADRRLDLCAPTIPDHGSATR